MQKLFNRSVCVLVFITDIPLLLLMVTGGITGAVFARVVFNVPFKKYWDSIVDVGTVERFKRLYAKLWRSFRDGELYS